MHWGVGNLANWATQNLISTYLEKLAFSMVVTYMSGMEVTRWSRGTVSAAKARGEVARVAGEAANQEEKVQLYYAANKTSWRQHYGHHASLFPDWLSGHISDSSSPCSAHYPSHLTKGTETTERAQGGGFCYKKTPATLNFVFKFLQLLFYLLTYIHTNGPQ